MAKVQVILDKHGDWALVVEGKTIGTLEFNPSHMYRQGYNMGKLQNRIINAISGVEIPEE